jgi:hypothetical protein
MWRTTFAGFARLVDGKKNVILPREEAGQRSLSWKLQGLKEVKETWVGISAVCGPLAREAGFRLRITDLKSVR